jgi:peptidoglycan/LPS O-acetylase OafA/YrhL
MRVAVNRIAVLALCPLTILACVFVEIQRGAFGRRLAFLGDISYGLYLLHFPLQLVIVLLIAYSGAGVVFLTHGWALIAFYAVIVPAALVVFHYYERPAQHFLRSRRPRHDK